MISLAGLNPAQQAAVTHQGGPCVVIAAAGSGKTRVLTTRIAYLIDECGIPAERIAAVTFTRKAAGEMAERLQELMGGLGAALPVQVSTIHSFCYHILREDWASRGESCDIISGYKQKRLIKDLLAAPSRNNPAGMNWDLDLKVAMARIGLWKNNLIFPDDISLTMPDGARWRTLYLRYEDAKARQNVIDLDDMMTMTYTLLRDNPAIRQRWHRQWPWLLIDEIQDNSEAQWEIFRLLAEPDHNLFVVGDDSQAIFSFAGARPDRLIHFDAQYPASTHVVMDLNYRSLPYIVDAGNRLIAWNVHKIPKDCKAVRTGATKSPTFWRPADEEDEAEHITAFCSTQHDEGLPWAGMAVIVRTNAQTQPLEDACVQSKIPYRVLGGKGFWGRREIQDMLAYLRIMEDPTDLEAYSRAIMAPSRYLGKAFIGAAQRLARSHSLDLLAATSLAAEKPYQRRNAQAFLSIIRAVQDLTRPLDQLEAIRDLTDYDAWFLKDDMGDDDDEDRLGNLKALNAVAAKFSTRRELLAHADMMQDQARKAEDDTDTLTILTSHRSKGLEWPTVILAGWVQGIMPHQRVLDAAEEDPLYLEEERRLGYVAVTRARDTLVISAPESFRHKNTEPSQFLEEMGVYWEDLADEATDSPASPVAGGRS